MTFQPSTMQAARAVFGDLTKRMLPLDRLDAEQDSLARRYAAAAPYPHIVLDDFFDAGILDWVQDDFPKTNGRDWISWDTENEIKQTSRGIVSLSPVTQLLFMQLCSDPFIRRLEAITGQTGLVWDPMFCGAGLHESVRGGWLNMHADWTKHPELPLVRRLNLIIYLNRDWEAAWNGALTLRDPDGAQPDAQVTPVFNRAALFPTTDKTLHGFPEPLECPADRSRRSISVYYWSADPEAVSQATYIKWLPSNGDTRLKALVRSFAPPVLLRTAARLRSA
ncbi:MAG: 2OG-Fe(II) oxygenase [Alphaproteobacteria bacterium]